MDVFFIYCSELQLCTCLFRNVSFDFVINIPKSEYLFDFLTILSYNDSIVKGKDDH